MNAINRHLGAMKLKMGPTRPCSMYLLVNSFCMYSETSVLALLVALIAPLAVRTQADQCFASKRAPAMLQLSTSNSQVGHHTADAQPVSLKSGSSRRVVQQNDILKKDRRAERLWSDIPKIIHQSWKTAELPGAFQRWSQTWKDCMPDWQYMLHTDEDNRNLFVNDFPELLALYDSYTMDVMRADAARFAYMVKYGGLYVDLDMECISNPLLNVSSPNSILLACEGCDQISNAFMAGGESAKGFFNYLLHKLPESAPSVDSSANPFVTTGPFFITSLVAPLLDGDFRTTAGTVKSVAWKQDPISVTFPNVTILDDALVFGVRWNDTELQYKALDRSWVKDHFSMSISHWTASWMGRDIPQL